MSESMAGTLITITDAGRAALVSSDHDGTHAHRVSTIGLCDAPFIADKGMEALPHRRKTVRTFAGIHVDDDTIHVTVKDESDDQFTLYGFGLYLENGVLFAAYGQATPIMEKSPAALLLLAADIEFTTLDAATLKFGDASFANPQATTSREGVVRLATAREASAGTDAQRVVTPATLKPLLDRKANLTGAAFTGPVSAPTPRAGDVSSNLATTEFVSRAIASALIGQIVMEARTIARAGFLKCNGAVLQRADYPALWAYAQASGALIAEHDWHRGYFGCFSTGDGSATFRIPELRGETLRCWDDGRGADPSRFIGSWQDSQNRHHAHGASAAAAGEHGHQAWTDAQGWHAHDGTTTAVGDHEHRVPSSAGVGQGARGINSVQQSGGAMTTSPAGGHAHTFQTNGAGAHGHNIGIALNGAHSHAITIHGEGGGEARPRNVALLAMIRAY
jgi:microcystin-dependent protein